MLLHSSNPEHNEDRGLRGEVRTGIGRHVERQRRGLAWRADQRRSNDPGQGHGEREENQVLWPVHPDGKGQGNRICAREPILRGEGGGVRLLAERPPHPPRQELRPEAPVQVGRVHARAGAREAGPAHLAGQHEGTSRVQEDGLLLGAQDRRIHAELRPADNAVPAGEALLRRARLVRHVPAAGRSGGG